MKQCLLFGREKCFVFFLFLRSCIGKNSWEWVGGINGLALGRKWIHLPRVLPEAGINLKGGEPPFLALLIKQHVAAHTWWCSYTEEGYGSTEPCFFFHGAEVAPWIPRAGFQDWRETCWHSWMLFTWLLEMRRVVFSVFVHHWPYHLHSHTRNEVLKNTFVFWLPTSGWVNPPGDGGSTSCSKFFVKLNM